MKSEKTRTISAAEYQTQPPTITEAGERVAWWFTAVGCIAIAIGVVFVILALATLPSLAVSDIRPTAGSLVAKAALVQNAIHAVISFCAAGVIISLGRFIAALGRAVDKMI